MSHYDPRERHLTKGQKTLQRLFPERQVMIRSAGRLTSFKFSTTTQLAGTALVALVAGWVGFSSVMYVNHENILATKQEEVARARTAYKSLLAQVSVYRDKITAVTENLEQNHSRAVSLLEKNASLDERLKAIEDELASTQAEKRQAAKEKQQLVSHLQKIRSELQTASKAGETSFDQAAVELKREQAARERKSLRQELGRLEDQMDHIANDTVVGSDVDSIEVELRKVVLQRDLAKAEGETLQARIDGLQKKLADMEHTQLTLIQQFTMVARDRSEDIEDALSGTGLNLKQLMKRDKGSAQGGPLVPLDIQGMSDDSAVGRTVVSMQSSFARWNALQSLIEKLPLGQPLRHYRITSTFGPRKDPVNGHLAFHEGLDLAAPLGTPVYASAPGRVTYAGWRGSYGRLIEIDHGNGIKTRYGHLRKILVRRGDRVDRSTKIALLGSTGRSTGPHVHYEVRVNGTPRNPYPFIKAGINVF